VLENQEVKMLGDNRSRRVDVRVVAATNRDLEAEVRAGRFRRDLYFRLSVLPLRVPPLRERMDDLPLLAEHFLQRFARPDGPKRFSPGALKRLLAHAWPGNVRELRNVVERAALLGTGEVLEAADLYLDTATAPLPSGPFAQAKRLAVEAFERAYAQRLMDEHHGNISRAARAAGLDRKSLQILLKRHGLRSGRRA
jgi:DNA-binding NtrC family response regulator